MQVDFAKRRKEAEDAGLLGSGDYLKLKEGDNRLRLLSECLPHTSVFDGRKNFKWLCYVIDRKDGRLKPFFMPHKIYKAIEALQVNPDYEFFEVPMPYDLTVNATKAGTKDVVYTVVPARKNTELHGEELTQLRDAKPLKELHQALLEKQKAKETLSQAPPDGDHDAPLTADDIPF